MHPWIMYNIVAHFCCCRSTLLLWMWHFNGKQVRMLEIDAHTIEQSVGLSVCRPVNATVVYSYRLAGYNFPFDTIPSIHIPCISCILWQLFCSFRSSLIHSGTYELLDHIMLPECTLSLYSWFIHTNHTWHCKWTNWSIRKELMRKMKHFGRRCHCRCRGYCLPLSSATRLKVRRQRHSFTLCILLSEEHCNDKI